MRTSCHIESKMSAKNFIMALVILVTVLSFSIPLLFSNATTLTSTQWKQAILATPVASVGCYTVSYPSLVWKDTPCVSPSHAPMYVGDFCCDKLGQVPSGDTIQTSIGDFGSISGITSIYDNGTKAYNYYSLQDNTNHFSTTYGSYGTVTGFQQFVFQNDPAVGHGHVFIQYCLLGYVTSFNDMSY